MIQKLFRVFLTIFMILMVSNNTFVNAQPSTPVQATIAINRCEATVSGLQLQVRLNNTQTFTHTMHTLKQETRVRIGQSLVMSDIESLGTMGYEGPHLACSWGQPCPPTHTFSPFHTTTYPNETVHINLTYRWNVCDINDPTCSNPFTQTAVTEATCVLEPVDPTPTPASCNLATATNSPQQHDCGQDGCAQDEVCVLTQVGGNTSTACAQYETMCAGISTDTCQAEGNECNSADLGCCDDLICFPQEEPDGSFVNRCINSPTVEDPWEIPEIPVYEGPVINFTALLVALNYVLVPFGIILFAIPSIIGNLYKLMTSQGNPALLKDVKEGLGAAFVGSAFILVAAALFRILLNTFLGANL